METTKRSKKKATRQPSETSIIDAYKSYLLLHGEQPKSVYKFCLDLEMKEEDFFNQFGSFEAIDRVIWKDFAASTSSRLQADPSFSNFTAREKLLTYYFALAEVLKTNRSYVLLLSRNHNRPEFLPNFLKDFKISFEQFLEQVLHDGLSKNEIAKRPFLDKRYPDLFWIHMSFFLLYWKDDTSKGFENTDAFIEKSINLAFDLIGKGALDTAVDFIKFLYQSKQKA